MKPTDKQIKSAMNRLEITTDGKNGFYRGCLWYKDKTEEQWIDANDRLPEVGIEVLLQNDKWINEDYNQKGIRIGFRDDVSGWTSAYWCSYHDEYHTRTSEGDNDQFEQSKAKDQIPTHWQPLPQPQRKSYNTEFGLTA